MAWDAVPESMENTSVPFEDSSSYSGKVFQTMEGIGIHHDSQMARNHLEQLQKFHLYLYGKVYQRVKSIPEHNFVIHESAAVYPKHVISEIFHLQQCEVLLQNMITSQRISLLESMTETKIIPLDSTRTYCGSKSAEASITEK